MKAVKRYSPAWCKAICRGLVKDAHDREHMLMAVAEVSPSRAVGKGPDPNEFHEDAGQEVRQISEWDGGGLWDDIAGMPLDRQKVNRPKKKSKHKIS